MQRSFCIFYSLRSRGCTDEVEAEAMERASASMRTTSRLRSQQSMSALSLFFPSVLGLPLSGSWIRAETSRSFLAHLEEEAERPEERLEEEAEERRWPSAPCIWLHARHSPNEDHLAG